MTLQIWGQSQDYVAGCQLQTYKYLVPMAVSMETAVKYNFLARLGLNCECGLTWTHWEGLHLLPLKLWPFVRAKYFNTLLGAGHFEEGNRSYLIKKNFPFTKPGYHTLLRVVFVVSQLNIFRTNITATFLHVLTSASLIFTAFPNVFCLLVFRPELQQFLTCCRVPFIRSSLLWAI